MVVEVVVVVVVVHLVLRQHYCSANQVCNASREQPYV